MRALIVQPGDVRAVVAAGRGLAAGGWEVGVGSPRRDFVAASRHVRRWHRIPSSWTETDAFIAATREVIAREGYDIVFGAGDAETLAISQHRHELGAVVPHPPHENVLRALDKVELGRAAARAGLRTPPVVELAGSPPTGPLVVKPRMNAILAPRVAALAAGPEEAAALAAGLEADGIEPLVQVRVSGGLMAHTVLADRDSRVVARVQQVADAIWPLSAGVSCRARSVPFDERFAARIDGLVADLGWTGLAQVQFLVPAEAEPVLVDFNGRLYGSLSLALAAGVNLPALWAALATGRPLDGGHYARPGARYQWLEGDLRRARAERRGGLLADVLGSLRYAPGAAHSLWSADDPLPALKRAWQIGSASARSRARAAGSRARR